MDTRLTTTSEASGCCSSSAIVALALLHDPGGHLCVSGLTDGVLGEEHGHWRDLHAPPGRRSMPPSTVTTSSSRAPASGRRSSTSASSSRASGPTAPAGPSSPALGRRRVLDIGQGAQVEAPELVERSGACRTPSTERASSTRAARPAGCRRRSEARSRWRHSGHQQWASCDMTRYAAPSTTIGASGTPTHGEAGRGGVANGGRLLMYDTSSTSNERGRPREPRHGHDERHQQHPSQRVGRGCPAASTTTNARLTMNDASTISDTRRTSSGRHQPRDVHHERHGQHPGQRATLGSAGGIVNTGTISTTTSASSIVGNTAATYAGGLHNGGRGGPIGHPRRRHLWPWRQRLREHPRRLLRRAIAGAAMDTRLSVNHGDVAAPHRHRRGVGAAHDAGSHLGVSRQVRDLFGHEHRHRTFVPATPAGGRCCQARRPPRRQGHVPREDGHRQVPGHRGSPLPPLGRARPRRRWQDRGPAHPSWGRCPTTGPSDRPRAHHPRWVQPDGYGGGISNNRGTLKLRDVVVRRSEAGWGGASRTTGARCDCWGGPASWATRPPTSGAASSTGAR